MNPTMEGRDMGTQRWISTTTAVYIYAFIAGIPGGAIGPATLQVIQHLVSTDLGFNGKNINRTSSGPCSDGLTPNNTPSSVDADNAAVQEMTTSIVTIGGIIATIPSLLITLLASSWSDGGTFNQHRAVAILPCAAFVIHVAIIVIISAFSLSPWYTLISSLVLGLGGGVFLQIATMLSYLMTTTDSKDRSIYVIYLQMLSFTAQGIAQIATGYLIEGVDFTGTFTCLLIVCIGMTIFVGVFPPIVEVRY